MRRLLVGLLVVLLLLVAADRVAVVVADRAVAAQLRSSARLTSDPSVRIQGFPFLTQALRGRYDSVQVHATDVRSDQVRLAVLDVTLRGVQVPLSDVLHRQVRSVPVSSLSATARLAYDDLAAAAGSRQVSLAPGRDGQVRVTGRVQVLGRTLSATALSRLRLDGRSLVVTAQSYEVGSSLADEVLTRALGGRLDLRVQLGTLPYGLKVTGVSAGPDGVVLTASAGRTVLRPR